MSGRRLTVTADDRSGAMEAAALCADAGLETLVVSWDGEAVDARVECVVIDLRSRHLAPERAAARIRAVAVPEGSPRVHKIDSTLRGNWAAELAAIGRPVRLVPAYPAAGRTCVGGVVLVHGVPVAETEFGRDPSAPVTSSRPADALAALGVDCAVVDAETDVEIGAAVAAVTDPEVVIAGPAAVIGAVARSRSASGELLAGDRPRTDPRLPAGDVLVVRGSRHDASRAQAAAAALIPGVTVIEAPEDLIADREVVALELAGRAHDVLDRGQHRLVVLLGGDTADAFLAERAVHVLGSVGVGMALGTVVIGERAVSVITKPGGFGATNALVDLLLERGSR